MPGAAISILRRLYGDLPKETPKPTLLPNRLLIPMVIGAAFPRTGTTSLKLALESLGFGPTYHINEMLERGHLVDWDVPDADYENHVFHVKPNFRSILDANGFQSGVDTPFCHWWQELLDEYGKDAKVILTIRDPDRWYDSVRDSIWMHDGLPEMRKLAYQAIPELKQFWDWTMKSHWRPWRFENRTHAIEAYKKYQAKVRAVVPAEQLLEFRVQDGWKPLCDFLGVPVPNVSFPRANTAEDQDVMAKKLEAIGEAIHAAANHGAKRTIEL